MRVVLAALAVLLLAGASGAATRKQGGDWTRFGYDAQRSSSGPAVTGITAANVRRLVRQRVVLDGTVDSSPIYLRGVTVAGRPHDTFFVTTTYGKTEAIDATTGRVLWRFTPPGYSSWAGSARITNATPLADPSRKFVYAVSPDGKIHKLSVANGREAAGWPVTITLDSTHEKIAPPLNYSRGLVLAATGGYIGDAPPYQGHVVSIDAATGRIRHVWNSLCSDRTGLITPSSCAESDSAIWGRGGVVVVPGTGNLLVATGNAKFDGTHELGRQRADAVAGRVAPAPELDADRPGDPERHRRRPRHDRARRAQPDARRAGRQGREAAAALTRTHERAGRPRRQDRRRAADAAAARRAVHGAGGLERVDLLRHVLRARRRSAWSAAGCARRGRTAPRARAPSSPAACSTSTTPTAG